MQNQFQKSFLINHTINSLSYQIIKLETEKKKYISKMGNGCILQYIPLNTRSKFCNLGSKSEYSIPDLLQIVL